MSISVKARKLGHKIHVAGRGTDKVSGSYITYQCDKCWMLATKQGGKEYGPLITKKCPGVQPYAKEYKRKWLKSKK